MISIYIDGFSQTQNIDSLKSLLEKSSDEQYVDVLFELARSYSEIDYDKCLYYSSMANTAAHNLGDTLRIIKTTRGKAQIYRRLGKLDSAVYLFEKVLPIARRIEYKQEVKTILNALGIGYLYLAKYDKALICFFESLELREKDNDLYEIGVICINIALTYYKLQDYQKALKYFNRSHKLYTEVRSVPNVEMVRLYLNLSTSYAYLGDHLTAAKIMERAFQRCNVGCPSLLQMAVYQESGLILSLAGKHQISKEHYLKSYEISAKYAQAEDHFTNLIALTQVYTSLNQLDSAEKYLMEAEKIIQMGSNFNYEMSVVYAKLASSHINQNNFEKATSYLLKYKKTNDSIFNQRLTTNLMKIEGDHIEREGKAKIESQRKILALNEDIIERQKKQNIFAGIIAALLLILAVVLVRNIKRKQRLNELLDQLVTERTRQLQLNRDALHRALNESEILHRATASKITSCLATIKGLCLVGSHDREDAREYLRKVSNALEDIRQIVARNNSESVSKTPAGSL